MNLMQLVFKAQGFPLKEAQRRLQEIQKECSSNVKAYHERATWEIFNHHVNTNSEYKKFVGSTKYLNWSDIPILTKGAIQVPIEKRLSEGYTKSNTHLHNTSGSSGTPFYFAKDKYCHALSWALIYNRFGWHGVKMGSDLQARFYGIPLNGKSYWKEQIKDRIAARVRFPVFDLSDAILEKYTKLFCQKPFVYINGYTSSLVLFANYLKRNNLLLKELCPSLQLVFTTSEVCDDMDRALMQQAFGVKVVNEYGAAELDLLGFEDTVGDFILNNETLLIEVLNDDNLPVKLGEEGRVIVTSLYNKAMPFIRYDLGDRILLKKEKKGSYKLIDNLLGRTNDIALLPSGIKVPGLTFYYITKRILENNDSLKEFIVIQQSLHQFHFEYVATRDFTLSEKKQIQDSMDIYLEPGLSSSFERKEFIMRTSAGKLKQFYSNLN